VSYSSYFFAAAFCFAHLLRSASAIFFLGKGERVLLFVVGAADADASGRPLRFEGGEPASALRASCRRAIWASIAINISEVVIAPLYQGSKVIDVPLKEHASATFQAERLNLMREQTGQGSSHIRLLPNKKNLLMIDWNNPL